MGVIHGVHAFVPRLLEQGRPSHIVNTASMAGLLPQAELVPYATTKHAVVGLSESLNAELAPQGIRVTALCPGVINTPIVSAAPMRGEIAARRANIARFYERFGATPDVVAEAVLDVLGGRGVIRTVPRSHVAPAWALWRLSPRLVQPLARLSSARRFPLTRCGRRLPFRAAHGRPGAHPQLLDHRPHRPRQVDARRPHPRADADGRPRARCAPSCSTRWTSSASAASRSRRRPCACSTTARDGADLPAAPDRHARARRLHLRGLALAGRVRGRAAGRRRLAGRRGADGRQHLPGGRLGPRADPVPEQDRPARRRARARGRRGRRAARRAARRDAADQRQDGRGRRSRCSRSSSQRVPPPAGDPDAAAARADLRLRVRPVPRRDRLHPRRRRRLPQGRGDPRDGRRAPRPTSTTSASSRRR